MKYKYLIKKDKENLIIAEYLQLEKEAYSFICEETYDIKAIVEASKDKNEKILIDLLRTNNIFPIFEFALNMAREIKDFINAKKKDTVELLYDDTILLPKDLKYEEEKEPVDVEAFEEVDTDILLDEDVDIEQGPEDIIPVKPNDSDEL